MERTRVFIVEDQPALLKGLVKVLGTYPEVEVVGTAMEGEQALAEIFSLRPDLVLLDLELPGIDGLEVTRRLRRRVRELPVEILVLTSFEDEQRVFDVMREGASGYLVKRAGTEAVRSAIAEVMAGGTVIDPKLARRFWTLFESVRRERPAQASASESNAWELTELEREILTLVGKGLSNAEVGRALTLQRRTVRTHLGHIYRKMGVSSHVEAVVAAVRAGLVEI